MNREEILRKAVKEAIENGMPAPTVDKGTFWQIYAQVNGRQGRRVVKGEFVPEDCYGLIFNHDFAKAFFGESWKTMLLIMVLEKDPVLWLENYL